MTEAHNRRREFESLTHARARRDGLIEEITETLKAGGYEVDEDVIERICTKQKGWKKDIRLWRDRLFSVWRNWGCCGIPLTHLPEELHGVVKWIARKERETLMKMRPRVFSNAGGAS